MIEQRYRVSYDVQFVIKSFLSLNGDGGKLALRELIERRLEKEYPGLLGITNRGYSTIVEEIGALCTPSVNINCTQLEYMVPTTAYISPYKFAITATFTVDIITAYTESVQALPIPCLTGEQQIKAFRRVFPGYFDDVDISEFTAELFAPRRM